MEQHAWSLMLAGWSLLLLLGLAGGDPFAAGQRGREAPATALARWLRRALATWRQGALPAPPRLENPPPRPTTESGFHPAV